MVSLVRVIERIHQIKGILAVRLRCQREDGVRTGFADINTRYKRHNNSHAIRRQRDAAGKAACIAKCARTVSFKICQQLTGR